MVVGAREPGTDVLDGALADVRIYGRALETEQISAAVRGATPAEDARLLRLTGAEMAKRLGRESRRPTRYPTAADGELPTADGFRGIWYANQPSGDEYKYKYSGGLATFPQQHHPIAVYAEEANKTFFVYGGRYPDRNRLLHMISFYDHATDKVACPCVLLDKRTADAHDNPVLSIDEEGFLWVFSNAHGTARRAFIHRSEEPHSIAAFRRVKKTNFSYAQPCHLPDHGFVFLHTRYGKGRRLHVMRSEEGERGTYPRLLAAVEQGHYQISRARGNTVATAFNYHPEGTPGAGLNWRTNLYYLVSTDGGRTWRGAGGKRVDIPVTSAESSALAVDYASKDRLVYLKDLALDRRARPVILYLTSDGYASGPDNEPRRFKIARWTGDRWRVHAVTGADNNYDFGSLYLVRKDDWRILAATEPSPQPFNTGGEVGLWRSTDGGRTWEKVRAVTEGSRLNHNYPRRPHRWQPEFAALWADGHGRKLSRSRLYFTDIDGKRTRRLPTEIPEGTQRVEPVPAR